MIEQLHLVVESMIRLAHTTQPQNVCRADSASSVATGYSQQQQQHNAGPLEALPHSEPTAERAPQQHQGCAITCPCAPLFPTIYSYTLCSCRMNHETQSASWLLELPEPCLLAVLRCCADDPRSLFSAARAHSRLHQAAVQSLNSITAVLHQQQQVDSMLLYLDNNGQHVSSLAIDGGEHQFWLQLQQLPHAKLQGLSSLQVSQMLLQLQPGFDDLGHLGVLGKEQPLEQLQLHSCALLDGDKLAAAFLLLPDLQHLSLVWGDDADLDGVFSSSALQGLQQLTFLELAGCELLSTLGMESLQCLTHLQDLRLHCLGECVVAASMLSDLQRLTHFKLQGEDHDGSNKHAGDDAN